MSEQKDEQLVALSRCGNKEAFGALIERYRSVALRIATRMISHPDLAQDLVQEAILEAYLSLMNLRNSASFKSWFYGIVLNVCRSYLRRQRIDLYSLDAMAGGLHFDALPFNQAEDNPHYLFEELEQYQTLLAAIDELSQKNRSATLLFYFEQLSLQEVAETLNISVTAVKSRLYKSRQQLREILQSTKFEESRKGDSYDSFQEGFQEDSVYFINNQKGVTKMISEVTDIIPVTIADVVKPGVGDYRVVVLLDAMGQRILPIWIAEMEAISIAMGLRKMPAKRPMTYHFMATIVESLDATLEEVRVESLIEDTFYAIAKVRTGNGVQEIDARPSDAMALAVRLDCPIYVTEAVMSAAGEAIPEGSTVAESRGIDAILSALQEKWDQQEQERAEQADEKEKINEPKEALIAILFE